MPDPQTSDADTVNDVSASTGISSPASCEFYV